MTRNKIQTVFLIIIFLTITLVQSKKAHKKILLEQLSSNTQTVFLAKFPVRSVGANIAIKYKYLCSLCRKIGEKFPKDINLHAGLLHAEKFYQHLYAQSCEEKRDLYHDNYQLKFFDSTQGQTNIKINKNKDEHLEFLYIYSCDYLETTQSEQTGLTFDVLIDNNGLGTEEFGAQLWVYAFLVVGTIGIILHYWKPILEEMDNKKNLASILLVGGFILLTTSVIFRFLSVVRGVFSGQSIAFFDALYITIKAIIQIIMSAILISIAWGWLLNNPRFKLHFVGIVMFVTILNVLSQVLADGNKQQISNQHLYQGSTGKLVLIMRVINSIVFISGCLYVSFQSNQKRQAFINNFAQVGAVFLLANLISLLASQIFSHSYRHGQVVPMLEDLIRLVISAYLCYLFAFPKEDGYHEVDFGFDLQDSGMIDKQINQYPSHDRKNHPQFSNSHSSSSGNKNHANRYQGKSADLI